MDEKISNYGLLSRQESQHMLSFNTLFSEQ